MPIEPVDSSRPPAPIAWVCRDALADPPGASCAARPGCSAELNRSSQAASARASCSSVRCGSIRSSDGNIGRRGEASAASSRRAARRTCTESAARLVPYRRAHSAAERPSSTRYPSSCEERGGSRESASTNSAALGACSFGSGWGDARIGGLVSRCFLEPSPRPPTLAGCCALWWSWRSSRRRPLFPSRPCGSIWGTSPAR